MAERTKTFATTKPQLRRLKTCLYKAMDVWTKSIVTTMPWTAKTWRPEVTYFFESSHFLILFVYQNDVFIE